MTERELVVAFKEAKQRKDDIEAALDDAKAVYNDAEMKLIEALTNTGADQTAKYSEIGYVKMGKPKVYASCVEANKDALKEHLRKAGREDMIKETVAAPSLSAYVGELIEGGKEVP